MPRFALRRRFWFHPGVGLKRGDPDGLNRNDLLVVICRRQLVVLAGEIDEYDIAGTGVS